MSINFTAISSILETQLKTVSTLPTYTGENVKAKPDATTPWCRATVLPAEPTVMAIGAQGTRRDQGLYQIDLYYPQNGGVATINAMADTIMNAFVRGAQYTSGSVTVQIDAVWRQPADAVPQIAFYHIPIIVRWVHYAQG